MRQETISSPIRITGHECIKIRLGLGEREDALCAEPHINRIPTSRRHPYSAAFISFCQEQWRRILAAH